MRKSIPLLLACALALVPSELPVYAAGFYGSAALGLSAPTAISFPDVIYESSKYTGEKASFKTAVAYRGEIGYAFRDCRIGVEFGAMNPKMEQKVRFVNGTSFLAPLTGDFTISSVMLNGYYQMKAMGYSPYLMAGFGVAQVKANNVTYTYEKGAGITYLYPGAISLATTDESVGAWQAGFGAAIPLRRGVQLDLGYRYFSTVKLNINSTLKEALHSSDLFAGLRFEL